MSGSAALRRIKSVAVKPRYKLAITWERGQKADVVDLSDMVESGGVFTELSSPAQFALVQIGENNRTVEWPNPKDDMGYPIISIDADSLFDKASHQEKDELGAALSKIIEALRTAARSSLARRPKS